MAGFHPASGEALTRFLAGAELNVAVHLARLGRSVTYVTRVGDDPFGEAIRDALSAEGVDGRAAVDPERRTGVYFRELGGAGPRRVYYYRAGSAASRLGPDDLPPLESYRIVHATGITAVLSPSCLAAVERASRADVFSFDVNFRPALSTAEGWRESTRGARSWAQLPATAIKYIRRLEELIGAPVAMLSTSPERDDTVLVRDPFAD